MDRYASYTSSITTEYNLNLFGLDIEDIIGDTYWVNHSLVVKQIYIVFFQTIKSKTFTKI